ncbi:Co2+/Mg2+ efflux protein ApaG [Sphingomonas sanxanigenens]|uniref:Protein ApaG n=1 Tax=Sphingomonas sanxanigenens DSM 19645 = NX02 TaxID=1123269 RepID=W0A6E5_9SPHN|nr:Co2+/Mg2+ efflux protein ApaG [Sphingomonas sanxanigenens]AHE53504.1 magnesium transporter ApaG [Sphingomonas sanxanigenens DSM 19645 = NX02]
MKAFFPHAETTRGITVRVSVSFLPEQSEPARGRWFWAYHIRIENEGDMAVQLMTRHWRITDGRGAQHEVEGEGVVGEQPLIVPGGAFDYVSGCPLTTPTGYMKGSYHMIGEDGSTFDVAIPRFPLTAPAVAN